MPAKTYIPWPTLIKGVLIKRYKRFLADVKLDNGEIITAHCPNSGRMIECSEPGSNVYLSYHDNPKRKLQYTWELIKMPSSLVGVNTNIPNLLVFNTIKDGNIPELNGYTEFNREKSVGKNSRLDIFLEKKRRKSCYVEVKNCTLVRDRLASFPDAVTARGLKHLKELQELKKNNNRCVMFYLVQRLDAERFTPEYPIDPAYGNELKKAKQNGVEILVYDVNIDLKKISINNKIPYTL
jgi:sugar fermentation stimulation protein A